MRKVTLIFALIFLFSFMNIPANGIDIDGDIQASEWADSTTFILFDKSDNSGCNIEQTVVKHRYDSESRVLHIAFICLEKTEFEEEHGCAVELSINGEEKIVVGEEAEYDSELYDVDFSRSITTQTSFAYELRIVLKKFGYEKIDITAKLTDSFGVPSKEYVINIYEETYEEVTTAPPTVVYVESKTKKATTTKVKTTKPKTTKVNTTNKKKTTSKATTVTTEQTVTEAENERVSPRNQKILKCISFVGIIAALAFVVIFSIRRED